MNWRKWIYDKLTTLSSVPASSILAGGSLTGSPTDRPFIVYRIGSEIPRLRDGFTAVTSSRTAEVWVYDDSGSYDRIDTILDEVKALLPGPVASLGATACEWISNGGEIADDEIKALCKVGSYQLIGAS